MMQFLINSGQFAALSHEDPQAHLYIIIDLTDTFIPIKVSTDYVKLTLFPHSHLGEAKIWLNVESANSITSWDDLARKFLIRFFQSSKTTRHRCDIVSFK